MLQTIYVTLYLHYLTVYIPLMGMQVVYNTYIYLSIRYNLLCQIALKIPVFIDFSLKYFYTKDKNLFIRRCIHLKFSTKTFEYLLLTVQTIKNGNYTFLSYLDTR
jgi:hypothetical protein